MSRDLKTRKQLFTSLFERESDAVFRFCLWRINDREKALEITQEAFTRLWKEFFLGAKVPNPKGFVYLTAKRLVIDWYRKKKSVSLEATNEENGENLRLRDEGAEEEVERYPDLKKALDSIKEMDDSYRDALYLRFFEGLNPREIAEALHLTPNAVSVRITKGLKKLREMLHIKEE